MNADEPHTCVSRVDFEPGIREQTVDYIGSSEQRLHVAQKTSTGYMYAFCSIRIPSPTNIRYC